MKKLLLLLMVLFTLNMKMEAQNMSFATFSFPAEIIQHDIPNSEVSAYLDNLNRTHIAWLKTIGSNQSLMYTVYDNLAITTVEIPTPSNTERKAAPYLILDANNHPHITYFVKRDPTNSSGNTGNFAVMYAGDPEGDGSFEVSQVSTNPASPTSNLETIYDCYVNGRPSIALDGTQLIISYLADASTLTSYDNYMIFATKNGSSWSRSQEYNTDNYGVTFTSPSNDINLPYRMTPSYHNAWLDISNYNPHFNFKTGNSWTNVTVPQYSGYTNIYNTQIDYDNSNNLHFMWFSDDSSRFYHTNINGASIGPVDEIEIIGKKKTTSNFHPATVDMSNGKLYMSYQRNSNSDIYVMTKDINNNTIETAITAVGTYYGKRCMNVNNGFISLVTASQTNGKIYISTNTASNSIKEISDNGFSISPNPAAEFVCFNLNMKNASNLKMNIYSILGVLIKSEKLNPNQSEIFTGDLNNGNYIMEIISGDNVYTQKFIIQK